MIKQIVTAFITTLALTAPGYAQSNKGRPASCLLIVKGFEAIRGECEFSPRGKDGSFVISAYNGKYFAFVDIKRKGVASGYWNGTPYAGHAHSQLGTLYREEGCWVNNRASVCAY